MSQGEVAEIDGFRALVLLESSWDRSVLRRIDEERLDALSVRVEGTEVDFLRGFPHLKGLVLNAGRARDLSVLHELSDLETLTLNIPSRPRLQLDFSAFPRLRRLGLYWNPGFESISALANLEELFVFNPPDPDLGRFATLGALRRLELSGGSKLLSTDGIAPLRELRFLGLYHQRSLEELRGLAPLRSLDSLALESCRRVRDIDEISQISTLRMLKLANCGDLPTLEPLRALTRLERFFAWESTRVLDGDLSVLTELPRLREVALRSRRSYRPSVEEIERTIASRGEPPAAMGTS